MQFVEKLHPFHETNVHERRWAALLARAFPLLFVLTFIASLLITQLSHPTVFLMLCAAANVGLYVSVTTMAFFGVICAIVMQAELETLARQAIPKADGKCQRLRVTFQEPDETGLVVPPRDHNVTHLIIIPNYKEDEVMLHRTLDALAQAQDSAWFHVVLAMEAREGDAATAKAEHLKQQFDKRFMHFTITVHPEGLVETHNDGSHDCEQPGKASNLKWAVRQVSEVVDRSKEDVILTVADADCIFHPCYFSRLARDYCFLRDETENLQHQWTMWQAPQLPYRNFASTPVVSRAWNYIASTFECGGVTSLTFGGHHMVFSAYSLSLDLALNANAWDGDVLAEDHHAFLKCLFYSILNRAKTWNGSGALNPLVRVRPVFLPVKSTAVVSNEGYWKTWVERWHQAKRHAHGQAEMSYALLACYDAVFAMPFKAWTWEIVMRLFKVLLRVFVMHLLPLCQFLAMVAMAIHWAINGWQVPHCSEEPGVFSTAPPLRPGMVALCWLAGAQRLVWPAIMLMVMLVSANLLFLYVAFVRPSQQGRTIWHAEDGGLAAAWGITGFGVMVKITLDCIFMVGPLMLIYGLLVEVIACARVCLYGNRIEYITAAKGKLTLSPQCDYGSMAT
mmetsp:Transcript_61958/g.134264  ORF Transcript_61958/g.134264 Transcript_61958/m.134264 type:complete len:620 (+) Transcript_61958:123-1982(+)